MAEKRVGTSKCGWCLTDRHEGCIVETQPWYGKTIKCSCGCEKGTKKPKARPVVTETVVSRRSKAQSKKTDRVHKVAQKELDKVLASDEVRKAVEDLL